MTTEHTTNWPELAVSLYDQLTGHNVVIAYEFVDMSIRVPSGTGLKVEHAEWMLRGTMKIRTGDAGQLPN